MTSALRLGSFACMLLAVAALVFLGSATRTEAGFRVLHEFGGEPNDGGHPFSGRLTLVGSTLYGVTSRGGAIDKGAVFQIDTDGTGYRVLHEFGGSTSDGSYPYSQLTLVGSMLYGTTAYGGSQNRGTIFQIDVDDGGYQVFRHFGQRTVQNLGENPRGALVASGSTLFGTTSLGGAHNNGTVFRVSTDGEGFELLHEFEDLGSGPQRVLGGLSLSGWTLFGMTSRADDRDTATVFRVDVDGGGFHVIHEFPEGGGNGPGFSLPHGGLAVSGSTLYGMTVGGGSGRSGSIFRVEAGSREIDVLHDFRRPGGTYPLGGLTLADGVLYGTTYSGGDGDGGCVCPSAADGEPDGGTIFQVNTDGEEFRVLHHIGANFFNSQYPMGDVILVGSTLFGMTASGGQHDAGTIFALSLDDLGPLGDTNGDQVVDLTDLNNVRNHLVLQLRFSGLGVLSILLPSTLEGQDARSCFFNAVRQPVGSAAAAVFSPGSVPTRRTLPTRVAVSGGS